MLPNDDCGRRRYAEALLAVGSGAHLGTAPAYAGVDRCTRLRLAHVIPAADAVIVVPAYLENIREILESANGSGLAGRLGKMEGRIDLGTHRAGGKAEISHGLRARSPKCLGRRLPQSRNTASPSVTMTKNPPRAAGPGQRPRHATIKASTLAVPHLSLKEMKARRRDLPRGHTSNFQTRNVRRLL
jgi:hypothetical protein